MSHFSAELDKPRTGLLILVQCLGYVSSREGKVNISRVKVCMPFWGASPQKRESTAFGGDEDYNDLGALGSSKTAKTISPLETT